MSVPEPMECLSEECVSPMRCNASGSCREAKRDGYLSYALGLAECRRRGLIPRSWRHDRPIETETEEYWR